MKPNIFDIGTKELNQDVFITWLLLYANEIPSNQSSEDDRLLFECSREFIKQLIHKVHPNTDIYYKNISAGRQWEKIDIWAEIDGKYLLIIEDKTSTGQHSGQLAKYKETAEKWCNEQNPKYEKPVCIYLKTGNEALSSLKRVKDDGFEIFNRPDFLDLLSRYTSIKNQIFADFYDRLSRLEAAVKEFENKNIGDWNVDDWTGFYQFLDSSIGLVNWYKLNNPNGGFLNAIIDWPEWNGFPVHYQIEQGRIAFKISFDPEEIDRTEEFEKDEVQDQWQSILLGNAIERFPEIKKPSPYFHRGVWRTVAFIGTSDWLGAPDSKLNKEEVIKKLESYNAFVSELVNT